MKRHPHKKLYVLYVITKLELGGAQKICLDLYQGVPEQGIGTGIMTGSEGELMSALKQQEHNTYFIGTFKREITFLGLINEFRSFVAMIKTMRAIKKEHPNIIVHTHSTKAGFVGRWAAFFARIPKRIHTIHGYGFHEHQWFPVRFTIYVCELITSLITTHFICVSSVDAKKGLALFPGFAKKHSIIRAAVDWNHFYAPTRLGTSFPSGGNPFIFGTIACFKPQKNLFDLLQAFARAHEKNPLLRLEIIGDGYLRAPIQEWIAKQNLDQYIVLHGWQHDVLPIVMHWNAFVLTSLWEGLPCSIVEARLLKLPILCYDTGGIRDVIVSGENGLLYKQGNWQAVASGMLSIASDYNLYQRLQNYSDDLSDFNNQIMIEHHVELYKNV